MPGIVGDLVAPEAAGVLADDNAVLLDNDAIGVGVDVDRPANRLGNTEYLLLSKRTRQVFETEALFVWKPSNTPR